MADFRWRKGCHNKQKEQIETQFLLIKRQNEISIAFFRYITGIGVNFYRLINCEITIKELTFKGMNVNSVRCIVPASKNWKVLA
jgi:hypothetical protein